MPDILIASNSSHDRAVLERLLVSHGCTVREARDGAETLALARKARPDLVVSDVLMPVMDGYYLLWLWKNDPALREVPFVIHTSVQTGTSDEAFATRLGADAFLVAPVPPSALWERLVGLLSAPQVSSPTISDAKTFLEHYRQALPRKAGEQTPSSTGTGQPSGFDPEVMESELEFRQVTEAMPQIVWVTRPDGWHTHFNQRWLDYTGLSLAESLGHGWLAPFHPEDQPAAAVRWAEANATGEPYEIEYRLRAADGTYRWMLGRALPLRNADGAIVKWMGTCTDIHDLKEAEAAMREKDAITRIAGRMTRTGGWALEVDTGRVFWSDELTHVLGYPEITEQQLQDAFSLYLSPGREILERAIAECMSNGTPFDLEAQLRRGDGAVVWVHVTGEAARDPDGKVTRVHGALQDISQRKELETRFLRAQRLDSIGTLASGIAHDFNNLLAPIVMGVSFLKRGEPSQKVLAVVDNIERSAERGKQLVQQILSFARGIDVDRIPVDLRQIIRDTEGMIADIFPKSIAVRHDVDENLWMSNGDWTQLTQVLMNLLVNARDAMPDGGFLQIRATNIVLDQGAAEEHGTAPGPFVRLEVSDDGCGIPPKIRDRIFEPFFTTKPFGAGTGLGLSTAVGIVRSHGGFIDFDSEPGAGTTFRVWLPAQPDAKTPDLPASDSGSAPRGNGELILVVDDEASILNVMQHTLEAYGYRSLAVENGASALSLYREKRDEIDLVITDMVMPGVDGVELIGELRRSNPELPIIAVSGKGSEVDTIPPEIEVSAFLTKPFSAERLLSILADLLG